MLKHVLSWVELTQQCLYLQCSDYNVKLWLNYILHTVSEYITCYTYMDAVYGIVYMVLLRKNSDSEKATHLRVLRARQTAEKRKGGGI